jgi:hypothetical protein
MDVLELPQPDNVDAFCLRRVTRSLIRGDRRAAAQHLQPLVGITWRTAPLEMMPARPNPQ